MAPDWPSEESSESSEPEESRTDDEESDRNSEDSLPPVRGTASGGFVGRRSRPKVNARRPNTWFQEQSDATWTVSKCHAADGDYGSAFVLLTEKKNKHGKQFQVYDQRLPKAKIHLDYDNCANALRSAACTCSKACNTLITDPEDVRSRREELFSQCRSELEVTERLVSQLKATQDCLVVSLRGGASAKVCRRYYAAIHGSSSVGV